MRCATCGAESGERAYCDACRDRDRRAKRARGRLPQLGIPGLPAPPAPARQAGLFESEETET